MDSNFKNRKYESMSKRLKKKVNSFKFNGIDSRNRVYISPKMLRDIDVYANDMVWLKFEPSKNRATIYSEEAAYYKSHNGRYSCSFAKTSVPFRVESSGALRFSATNLDRADVMSGFYVRSRFAEENEHKVIRLFS
jgi:hypothetical protein